MTVELADYLIGLDKKIVKNDEMVNSFQLEIKFPLKLRLFLSSPDDLDQNLLIDIKESEKKTLKISLHHQDNGTQNGLLRVDYNARHLNPAEINVNVPEKFKPFAGQWLDNYPGHIHYVVDGYKPLAWAIPLETDNYLVKELKKREDYAETLDAFFKKINLKTKISYNHQLRIL